jgi:acetyl esterase/lipase
VFAQAVQVLKLAACIALWLVFSFAKPAIGADKMQPSDHLAVSHCLTDLLAHPAFAGFSRRLLPWDDREVDPEMRLADIAALMPYHSHVRPDIAVDALNRLIDDAAAGNAVFYDIYSDAQKRQQPAKGHTGLFFFRGRPGAPFAIVSPGGGFAYVGSLHEGFPYAAEISRRGYNVFVLKYRAGLGGAAATEDLAAAISYVFEQARTLGVGTAGYSVWGSSAGARMAAAVGTHGVARFGGRNVAKPSAVVMAYTGHSEFSADDPPTFAVVGEQDGIASPATMQRRIASLRSAGVPAQLRRFPNVGHGFGLGTGTSAEGWVGEAVRFWESAARLPASR